MTRSLTSFRKSTALKKSLMPLALFVVLIAFPRSVNAQVYGSRTHTVTVNVATINNLAVSAGSTSLTIGAANVTAGQNLMGPVVNTATSLLWGINSSLKKVTVRTNLVAPKFTLKVLAVAPTQGTASAEVTLNTTDKDFLINLGRSSGTCTLQYTGTALASTGTGTDSHTLTFSIVVQ